MNIRQKMEVREHQILSKFASFSDRSIGRGKEEPLCDLRPCYERDRDRILHCKAFRRLKLKTQVFLAPVGDHYRTRLTHTLEVSQIARTIAKALRLNEDLTEAIALGHDLGHTPFGHAGERALDLACSAGFRHQEQSVRVVECLEKNGQGMNLTYEVRDGIRNHQTTGKPKTLEAAIVRLSDKIAYISHDIDDAIRGHIIKEEDIPYEYRSILGFTIKERLNHMVHDIVSQSEDSETIRMSDNVERAMFSLRQYMFQNLYTNPVAKGEEKKAENLIIELYHYYCLHPEALAEEYQMLLEEGNDKKERIVCDYIAGMTDRFAIDTFQSIKIPTIWSVK